MFKTLSMIGSLSWTVASFSSNHGSEGACQKTCESLSTALPGQVTFAGAPALSYHSLMQEERAPTCRVEASSSEDIAYILNIIQDEEACHFAVRGGGHGTVPGASNVRGGVTIDLARLFSVELSPDQTSVRVGGGARWVDVYRKLDPLGLSMNGGRTAYLGIGGHTLGGGLSFFSGRNGFTCDSVSEFEVVLPNGTIVKASPGSNPELFYALRGGGPNFGIVSAFTYRTFPQGLIWGGPRIFQLSALPQLASAFTNRVESPDPDLMMILAVTYTGNKGGLITISLNTHAIPEPNSPSLSEFAAIVPDMDGTRIDSIANFTLEISSLNPHGSREMTATISIRPSAKLIQQSADLLQRLAEPLRSRIAFQPAIFFQAVTSPMLDRMKMQDGNVLGLDSEGVEGEKSGFLIIMVVTRHQDPTDDQVVVDFMDDMISGIRSLAVEANKDHQFLYMNYALGHQDVYSGYGSSNYEKLIKVAREVDPTGWWAQRRGPHFTLWKQDGKLCDSNSHDEL